MWSLGKVTGTPEVKRVYISSFWDKPFTHAENKELFEKEREDLFKELRGLPRNAAVRKVRSAWHGTFITQPPRCRSTIS